MPTSSLIHNTNAVLTKYTRSTYYTRLLVILNRRSSLKYVQIDLYVYSLLILLESYPYYLLDKINRATLELTSTGDHLIHHPAPFKETQSSPPPALSPSPSLSLIPSFRFSLLRRFHDGSSYPIVSHREGRQLYFPVSRSELD